MSLEGLFTGENILALVTLSAIEIVLGIDNIIFIAILTGKLPEAQRARARRIGLILAMGMRIALLLGITWVMRLTAVLFTVMEHGVTGRDLVLIIGGGFLIAKATFEVHHRLEDAPGHVPGVAAAAGAFGKVLFQIMLLDIVFSLDSVITAVGMAQRIEIMIAAVVLSVGVMMAFAGPISGFIEKHPTLKMLALAFLLLIGVMLVADGFGHHIPKGYIYFAMAFSLGVEMLNIRIASKHGKAAAAGHEALGTRH